MEIGLTYDLRDDYLAAGLGEEETAEFDRVETIDFLAGALVELGHRADRIGNIWQLTDRLAQGHRWDLVLNISEGLYGQARESQVPSLLDAYQVPYTFSDPLVMAVCLDKGLAKLVVQHWGLPTPEFAVVRSAAEAQQVDLALPVFAKPLAEGTGKGVSPASKVEDRATLVRICEDLLERFRQPVLVERYLPGREFTVGLIGTGPQASALGTLEIVLLPGAEPGAYSYVNKEECERLVEYRLVRAEEDAEVRRAEEIALEAWRALGCRDGGRVDLRSDQCGRPQFLEVNPLAGLHPAHSDLPMLCTALGISYVELIGRIVDSAARRAGKPRVPSPMGKAPTCAR